MKRSLVIAEFIIQGVYTKHSFCFPSRLIPWKNQITKEIGISFHSLVWKFVVQYIMWASVCVCVRVRARPRFAARQKETTAETEEGCYYCWSSTEK